MTTKPEAGGDFRIAPFEAWASMWKRFGVKVEKPGKRGVRIHVKNLSDGATSEELHELFAPFGSIIEADVKKDDSGKCRGFGYVILSKEEEATKAVAEMNGKKIEDRELAVILVERKEKGKGKDGKGKGKDGEKGKGKGKGKGKDGDTKGKGKGKGKGKAMDHYSMPMSPYANPYFYGMPPYGMPYPYMYGMPPFGYPMASPMGMGMYPGAPMPTGTPTTAETTAKAASPFFPGGAKGGKGKSKGGKSKDSGAAVVSKDPPPADKEFKGSLKSKSEKNGYGFITCAEAKELYDRDVWVDGDALPATVKEGDKLKFNVTLSAKGHPQASNVKTA